MHSPPRKLLHVDDAPAFLRLMQVRLGRAGYDVRSLADPAETLPALLGSDEQVVLLDLDLPGVNGLDLLRAIKRQDGGVQVVVLTGLASVTTLLGSLRAGAEACVFKPVDDLAPLTEALEHAFAKLARWRRTLAEWESRRRETAAV